MTWPPEIKSLVLLWLLVFTAPARSASHEEDYCEACKEITGKGPLAGIYYFLEQLDQPVDGCKDGCIYSKGFNGTEKFCFSARDMGYRSHSCQQDSSLPYSTKMPHMDSTPFPSPYNTKMPEMGSTLPHPLPPNLPKVVTMIEEDGEIVEQTDKFNIDTGEISIQVSSHRDVQKSTIIMGTRKGTLMRSTSDRCQIKSIPAEVVPESMLNSLDTIAGRTDPIRKEMEETHYSFAVEKGEASVNDLNEMSPAMKDLCKGKPIKVTEEKTVTKEEFQKMAEGKLMQMEGDSSSLRLRSKRAHAKCKKIERVCSPGGSGCWRWPYGNSFSLHNLYQDVICIDCCTDGEDSQDEGGLCHCNDITSIAALEACVTPINSTCPDGFYTCGDTCQIETQGPMKKCNGNCPPNRVHCGDKCVLPEDNYRECNEKCIPNTIACEGECPTDMFTCGVHCIANKIFHLYTFCNGVCQLRSEPCDGVCQEGMILCGDVCTAVKSFGGDYRKCGSQCLFESQPCNGTCPANRQLCQDLNVCIGLEDKSYRMCDGKCLPQIQPCNNLCPNATYTCGDKCYPDYMAGYAREEDEICMFYRPIDQHQPLQESNTWPCEGEFIPEANACHEKCPDGRELCGVDKCKEEGNNQLRTCGEECLNALLPCEGECPPDRPFVCGGECFPPSYQQIRRDCNGTCIDKDSPCDGDCPEASQILCNGECIADNGFFRSCEGECIHNTVPCNGICPGTMYLCGDICFPSYVAQFKWTCEGKCQDNKEQCNGQCPEGWAVCQNTECCNNYVTQHTILPLK